MQVFTIEHTPAEVVNAYPKASDLFRENEINFCCQGDRPLRVVLKEKGISEKEILVTLNTGYNNWIAENNSVINWDAKSLSDIVNEVDETFHGAILEELFSLDPFVTRVYHRHGNDQAHLVDMYHLYYELKELVEAHIIKEEKEWFPLIRNYEREETREDEEKITELQSLFKKEHEEQVSLLSRIRNITNDFTPPTHACNTYRITYARLSELYEILVQSIHVENNVIMKRLRAI